ncbi:hypothetical protein [Empedobacter sp.]|uniref:hypothetical protein n=1 Tax=Empedobacter sp. TaxID=1927715 RepID=UPI0028AA6BB1|nr:hypothetical protein [Empedobacter sp.]
MKTNFYLSTKQWKNDSKDITSVKFNLKGQWCPNCKGYYLDDFEDMCQICGWPYNH